MKKETSGKKSLLWLWITIAVVVVVAATVAALFATGVLGGEKSAPKKFFSELYWNVDRASMVDEETGLSNREPAEDGLYYVRFAVGGEQVEYSVADKTLVNKIDLKDVMCLKFDAEGTIIDVVNVEEVYTLIAENACIQNIEGQIYLLNSSQAFNGLETTVTMGEDVGVYNMIKSRPEVPGRLFKTGELDEMEIMDTVTIYGTDENTPTDVFITSRPYASKVYWRAEPGQFNSTEKRSTREQAEDGYWYIKFFSDGEINTYRTSDQSVINALDGYGIVGCACSLVFDHEGNVVDCAGAQYALRGKLAAVSYNVTELSADGKTFTATKLFAGNETGRTFSGVINEDTKVYNVNTTADQLGEETALQDGDLLYILTDSMGNVKVIFVTNRYVDSPMYFNVSQKYDSKTKSTTRVPDADGWYTIELAVKGQLKKFRTRDRSIVQQIDTAGNRCMGLKVSGDLILKYYDPACVTGNWSFGSGYFVISAEGVILSCESTSGVVANGVMVDGCEIYDVSGHSSFKGQVTTLREGDRIIGYKNPQGEVTHVYVISRYEAGTSLYYNVNRNTSRKPDADGWYVYKMIKMGQTGFVTVKTKDAAIAKLIDTYNPAAMTLRVNSEGVVTKVYNSNAFTIGYEHLAGIHALSYNSSTGKWLLKYRSTGAEANLDMSDVAIYNFSGIYDKAPGERTTLRAGDRIETIYDSHGKIKYAWVYERESGSPAYWLKDPKTIDSKTGYTSREKAADGYYYFTVTANGVVKTVKTNDIEVATAIDNTVKNNLCLAFGLKLDGDIVKAVYSAVSTKDIYASAQSYYDVTAINGNTVTLERLKPGSSNTGDKQVINISAAKIYEVSPYAGDKWGKPTKLTIGDRVQTYYGDTLDGKTITLIYVAFHNTHEAGAFSYCEHCGETVFWQPYVGTCDYIKNYSYHYYLTADYERELSTGWGATGGTTPYDWVLDLNGYTYRATGSYAYAVRGSSTLTVLDTSKAKTGRITGVGVQIKDADGNKSIYQSSISGIFQVLDNGTLNLRGGTYTRTINREITNLRRAGVAIVNKTGTLNIYDGAKLVNNDMDVPLDLATDGVTEVRRAPQGGALYNNGGTINIYGGLISNNGKIHEDFKAYENAVSNGGNIFQAAGELNISGGKITNGYAVGNGGNIYVSGGKVNISGGEISNGTSVNSAANNMIVAANKNVVLNITGGTITGDLTVGEGNTFKISGKPQITMGEEQGLFLNEGALVQVGNMTDGAKVVISSAGTFTTDFASEAAADAMLARNIFVPASAKTPIYREGKALAIGKKMCINGHTTATECAAASCDKELLDWNPWESTDSLPTSGNYYLTGKVTIDASVTTGDLVLDLNGYDITRTVTAAQVSAAESTYALKADASKKLIITDLSGNTPGTVKVECEDGVILTGTAGIISLATGGEIEIYNGTFDGSALKTSNANAGGIICGGGKLTIHDGTFCGWSNKDGAATGIGSVFGGWSTSVLTINGGTFYGGQVKQGGMFASTGRIIINDGTFNGNNSAGNAIIDDTKPRTVVTHGGLILAQANNNSYLEINGGTFTAARTHNSGGMIYVEAGNNQTKITGGTFALSQAGNGGFIRFRGKSLEITGVTLEGGKANSGAGDIINMNSNGTLTIGKDAVIGGGIELSAAAKLVLKDNVKINEGENYAINLGTGTLDISGLNDEAKVCINHTDTTKAFAEAADEATAKKLVDNKIIVSADPNYRVIADGKKLTVKTQIQWQAWDAAAAATMYGGNEADNLHLTKLPKSGDWKLTDNVTVSATTTVTASKQLNLNLNGFTITRDIKAADAAAAQILSVDDSGKLYITDEIQLTDPSKEVGGMVLTSVDNVAVSGSYGLINVASGSEVTIDNGVFDGRAVKFSGTSTHGLLCGSGILTINGGTFYGMSGTGGAAAGGDGSVWGGWSASEVYINGGTFYGGQVKQGGMFATTGKIHITDGVFNGNNSATNTTIDSTKPLTYVTHGGLFYMASNAKSQLIIEGGTFIAPRTANSGGMIYTGSNLNTVTITGGTFQLAKATTGGFIRFRGSNLTIEGVTLTGATATNGNQISFEGTGTLTIGKDAVINGGIRAVSGKVLLKENAQVNYADGTSYSLQLTTTSVYIGSTSNAAVATVGSTTTTYVATYDANGNVTGVAVPTP